MPTKPVNKTIHKMDKKGETRNGKMVSCSLVTLLNVFYNFSITFLVFLRVMSSADNLCSTCVTDFGPETSLISLGQVMASPLSRFPQSCPASAKTA